MGDFKKYDEFLLTEKAKKKELFRLVLNDINIYMDEVITLLSDKFNFRCWFLYNNNNRVAIQYYSSADNSKKNTEKIRTFLIKNLPYLQSVDFYDDDHRMVLKFTEVGDPVRFKFYF